MIKSANPESIAEAAEILKSGGLVGMPTETVYGLAADATNGQAVAKIFAAKGRPSFNPLIIHVTDLEQAGEFVVVNDWARAMSQAFWPGPLTLILPKKENTQISELASTGLETLAVRVPAHKVARALIKAACVPLAAPSANASGTLSPTTAAHVYDSLGDKVDIILAAGACAVGLESTVLDLSGEAPLVLRPGGISAEDISKVLGVEVRYDAGDSVAPKSPGQLLKHYAPNLPVRLNAIDLKEDEALLAFGRTKFMIGSDFPAELVCNLSENKDLYEAAANLFAMLKVLDESGAKGIAVMAVPEVGIGIAINDRLRRAAQA
ncbi:MAG TPA: L-threonylcarbamoyladenylate synthase [Alphaproteobacteria bacterium]|nr:threonylcarbamoyl-AMP synthase [Alphaproteobacteria bacterium]USO05648.1 MAG: threonylcarbamoyl-AMP synthase [Rhodospirillales bacterium]HOO82705.1 L-threonylcarbamoyladenylate synthase [Alphaproteobacteria bacterium]